MPIVTLILIIILLITAFKFLVINHDYWKRMGVPHKRPYPFFGNLLKVFFKKETYQDAMTNIYREFQGHRYCGLFNMSRPTLMVRDLKLIMSVLKSDFSRISSRGLHMDHKRDPLSANLFFMEGHLWKRSRELLRPGFKSGRMRTLVPLVEEVAGMVFGKESNACLEVKTQSKLFSAAVIAGPVLGLKLDEDLSKQFTFHCDQAFSVRGWRAIPVYMRLFVPKIALFLGMKPLPQESEIFFLKVTEKILLGRKEGLKRDDFIQTIISAVDGLAYKYQDKELLTAITSGNFFLFVLAGFETISSTLTRALHLLAKHGDICNTARQEIFTVMKGNRGNFTYDNLKEMKNLDNIINETLRLYPPIGGLFRMCTTTFPIPGTNIVLKPGDTVHIPVLGVQTDPQYFENPDEFLPSRFDGKIIEGSFIPFADGPRNCLGMRMALTVLKIVLAYIISNFNIKLDPKTPDTLEVDPEHLINAPKVGVWIHFNKI